MNPGRVEQGVVWRYASLASGSRSMIHDAGGGRREEEHGQGTNGPSSKSAKDVGKRK